MADDPQDIVSNSVRDTANNLKNAYTFQNQRQGISDWWNDKVGAAKNLWNKTVGSGNVKASESPDASAPQPKTATPKATTPSIKRSAAKRKSVGGMSKSFGGK